MMALFNRILAAVMVMFLSAACSKNNEDDKPASDPWDSMSDITVSKIAVYDGKPCLEVDGKPFAVYGAQIRIDIFRSVDKMDWSGIEKYFSAAKELGLNCVQVPCPWAFLEPKEDQYDYETIDKILEFAVKYGVKVELLWFSTNFIGDSYSWLVPTYILSKPALRLKRSGEGDMHYLYGYTYSIKFDDEWLLMREKLAVCKLFGHIRWWDENNGGTHPVISCQVHNEPDALVRWRLDEKSISWTDGTKLTKQEVWAMTLTALDEVGKAVKGSRYKVATRTNIISGNGVKDFPQTPGISPKDVFALEGIDFVSYDPYMTSVNSLAYEVSQYASLEGNYPLVAENRGDFANSPSLMLAVSALGGGYDIYDLATSPTIKRVSAPPFNTEGILDSDLTPKPHTAATKLMIKGLVAAADQVAVTPTEDFAAFNIRTDNPEKNLVQTISTTGATFRFQTSSSAVGFALDRGSRIYAYSTAEATLTVTNGRLEGNDAGVVLLEPGKLYEFGFVSSGKTASTTRQNIGTKFK